MRIFQTLKWLVKIGSNKIRRKSIAVIKQCVHQQYYQDGGVAILININANASCH